MASHVTIEQRPDGWYVVATEADNVVFRTEGKRLTVALTPDDDDGSTTPLKVELAPKET